jgi:hypothetical protein
MQKQYKEGIIKNCSKEKCKCSCCDDDQVQEWVNEYFAFHEKMKDYLVSIGMKIRFEGDRVWFKNCSDGKDCKFIKYSINNDVDLRPIDCKIYPYVVDWDTIDFDKKIVNLYYWDNDCPLVKNGQIPKEFTEEVEKIIKRDFHFLFYGTQFKVKFIKKIHG